MLSHDRVWAAIDALAERYSLSASGLAKRAGLDSTAFNKSKRQSSDGRPRWPSTESLAKIIEATGATLNEFMALVENRTPAMTGSGRSSQKAVPLVGFAQAGAGGYFDDAGFPVGQGWDLVELPAQSTDTAAPMLGGLQTVYVREIRLWRRFEVVSSIETWEGTQVLGSHRFVLDNGETAALMKTTAGVYDRAGRRFIDIQELTAALGYDIKPRAPTAAEQAFMASHQGLRAAVKSGG